MNKHKFLVAGLVLAIASLGGINPAQASSQVSVDLPNEAVAGGTTVQVPVTLANFTDTELSVRLVAGAGTLTLVNPGAISLNPGYSSLVSQSELSFHGLKTDLITALETNLSWTAPGDSKVLTLMTMRVEVSKYVSGTTYDPVTGHTYVYEETPLSWHDALVAAQSMTYEGKTGYLATITSKEENDFIGTKAGAINIWIGATDDRQYVNEALALVGKTPVDHDTQAAGEYYWATGPETGTQFGSVLWDFVPLDGAYNSWSPHEPNNFFGEACGVTNSNTIGMWNDLDCSTKLAYLVEFSTDLNIFEKSVFTFDNILGQSKDSAPEVLATPELADTGLDAWIIAGLALAFIGVGTGLRVVARRK